MHDVFAKREFENRLTRDAVEILRQGIPLIEKLTDAQYAVGGRSSVGAQFRHCLDYADAFLRGLKTGELNYADRERDEKVETDRRFAVEKFETLIKRLQFLPATELEKKLKVKPEEISGLTGEPEWAWSSGRRELDAVQSHTVHHFALIALRLHTLGVETETDFGVAPATLRYWKRSA